MTAAITRSDRWSRANPCPICGGFDTMPRGEGKRCSGFVSSDGDYLHCSREEHSGGIESSGETYGHRRNGPCKCGTTHGEDTKRRDEIEAAYQYTDEAGALLFEVVRFAGKQFRQRKPDGGGGWVWKLNGVRLVPYRLPEVLADDGERPVYVVEGEKDVEAMWRRGYVATCNPGGAGKWRHVADVACDALQGRDVIVIADDDKPNPKTGRRAGHDHARDVEASLRDVAGSVRVVRCPTAKDVSEHFAAGGTLDELVPLEVEPAADAPPWERLVMPVPDAWYETRPPARAWLLRDSRRPKADGLLPLGKVGQCIAEGGAGKTMAAFQLAVAVATCTPWLGTFDVAIAGPPREDGKPSARPGRVLLVVGEEDADEAHRRCYRARKASGAPKPAPGSIVALPLHGVPCPMLMRDEQGEPTDAPFLTWLRAYVARSGPWDLIIVDPLSRFAGPDAEIDNAVATRFVQSLESIATLTGATVLVCHHTNKLARRGGAVEAVAGRGSSALVDGVRWQCSLGSERVTLDDPASQERLGELVVWAHTKSNYSRRADDLLLRRDLEHGGALVPLDSGDLEAVQEARGRDERQERRQALRERQEADACAREDKALAEILAEPDAPTTVKGIRAALRAALGTCSNDRADAAMARRRKVPTDAP